MGIGVQSALLLADLLLYHCQVHCNYDFYVAPLINYDGFMRAAVNNSWTKTTQNITGSSCQGVSLLNNFADGNFSQGSNDPCSQKYRGPSPMSTIESSYQTSIKAGVKNIALSVTLTQVGSKFSSSYAYKSQSASSVDENYMKAFQNATKGYETGVYANLHEKSYGHPMDYNTAKYKHSYNVALEKGTVGEDDYEHASSQVTPIFENFFRGLTAVISYAKTDQSFSV